jgi:hypothetical protein
MPIAPITAAAATVEAKNFDDFMVKLLGKRNG